MNEPFPLPEDKHECRDALHELYGLDHESFPTRFLDFVAMVHPDDRQTLQEAVQSALDGADQCDYLVRVELADGWRWVRGRGVVRRADLAMRVSGPEGFEMTGSSSL